MEEEKEYIASILKDINECLNKMSDTSLKKVFDYTQWRYVRDYDFDNNSEKECDSHE